MGSGFFSASLVFIIGIFFIILILAIIILVEYFCCRRFDVGRSPLESTRFDVEKKSCPNCGSADTDAYVEYQGKTVADEFSGFICKDCKHVFDLQCTGRDLIDNR